MKQLLRVLIVIVVAQIPISPAVSPVMPSSITFTNPEPQPDYTPKISRQRQPLQLHNLPAKWQRLAWCESRHRLHAVNNHTYYGLWQIHKGWYKPFNINPKTATLKQQWLVAQHVYRKQGAKAWTCAKQSQFE